MAINHKRAHVLIGGVDGAVDKIDGAGLSVGDTIQCININGIYDYVNVQDSRAELSPFTIRPDTNPGTNSWHLVGTTASIGALVKMSSDQILTTAVAEALTWATESYDIGGFWVIGSPTRFTIPIGVTGVIIKAQARFAVNTVGDRNLTMQKGGSYSFDGRPNFTVPAPGDLQGGVQLFSAKLVVAATNYFEVLAFQSSTGDLNVEAHDTTWFSIEATNFG